MEWFGSLVADFKASAAGSRLPFGAAALQSRVQEDDDSPPPSHSPRAGLRRGCNDKPPTRAASPVRAPEPAAAAYG